MLNELNLTPELLEKAKSATSATALLAFAQENDITLTTEEATNYYTQLHPKAGALSDDELDNVAGGGGCGVDPNRKLAIDYLRRTYCGRDQRCLVFQAETEREKDFYLSLPRVLEQLCYKCPCKASIDAYCISMSWPTLEFASHLYEQS